MNTEVYKITNIEKTDDQILNVAAAFLRRGELVAFPTETVYGLGADALQEQAAKKIYAAKGRPSDNPLIVHIADISDLDRIAMEIPREAYLLAEAFWPGPLTMVLKKNDNVPGTTTGGLQTVAVRMPSHPVALELIRKSGCLLAAPSANRSGRPSPTNAEHVYEDFQGIIPLIIDAGAVSIGIESTIVDLSEEEPMILRPGYITPSMLETVLKRKILMDPGLSNTKENTRPKAPGMRYKHYAPRAELFLVDGEREKVAAYINKKTVEQQQMGRKVGIIGTDETISQYCGDIILSIGAREDEDAIARHLYAILRRMDQEKVSVIYSESFLTPRIGHAIMNRLLKAAGYQILEV
ncbi:MAG: L-threonylcarbamoyladenylate synthase [Lachnospiraceae bacterium]